MTHELPPLPYAFNALEPAIDDQTGGRQAFLQREIPANILEPDSFEGAQA